MSFWSGIFGKAATPAEPDMPHIAVVYPATFPSLSLRVPEPNAHCTIMYLGTVGTVDFTAQDVIDVLKNQPIDGMLWARVTHGEMFGPENNVPVLRVDHNMLPVINQQVTEALGRAGIKDPSVYANEYKPHVTVSQETWDAPPHAVLLTAPQLWWGGVRMVIE